jgi:hypothetical protein
MVQTFGRKSSSIDKLGFALLDVLIAMFVATVGLLSLSMMQASAIKGNCVGNRATQATFLAQEMMERIKDGNIVNVETFGLIDMSDIPIGTVQDSGVLSGINERGEAGGPFTVQWKVFTHTKWSRRITVDVSWHSILGKTRNVGLATVSRGGGN